MGREKKRYDTERLNVWVLTNQVRDIDKVVSITGKTKTEVVIEALGVYFNMLRKQGVI